VSLNHVQAIGRRGKVVRVFDSGDLRVVMKEGSTWTFNPECCTLLSEEAPPPAAAAAAAETVESSSDDDDDDESIQITCKSLVAAMHVQKLFDALCTNIVLILKMTLEARECLKVFVQFPYK